MRLWHKIFIAFMLCASIGLIWENLSNDARLVVASIVGSWMLGSLLAFLVQRFTAERAFRPYLLGTRFQRRIFWRTMLWGPLMLILFLLSLPSKGKPLIKLPD